MNNHLQIALRLKALLITLVLSLGMALGANHSTATVPESTGDDQNVPPIVLPPHNQFEDQNALGPSATVTQTLELNEGWNWISTYIQVDDPLDMLTMLEEALGENGMTIKSSAEFTTYEDGEWGAMGELDDIGMVNQQMYMVQVNADCSVQLQGMLVNPETTIYIQPGWNWIGFPSSVTMSIEDALAGYEPEEDDIIKDEDDFSIYEDGEWGAMGELEELVAGRGFMFFSNANGTKILIFGL